MKEVARFRIAYHQLLKPDGSLQSTLPEAVADPELGRDLYRTMTLARAFDAKAIALQRTGQLGTYASTLGQEAIGAAIGAAMDKSDVFLPNYRDTATLLARGVSLYELLLYWGGDERGSDFAHAREDFPICIPVATQNGHAVGVATAIRIRGEERAALCTMGDGATSKGDFYEAINLAGVWRLPVVFVINNNQWAISVPRERQSAAETLAQKAIAAGLPGIQVDGNDALALYQTLSEALQKAHSGGGATVIEALTYRLCDHTTADDASRYRDDEEVGRHWKEDPIARLRHYLSEAGEWDKEREEQLIDECSRRIEEAVQRYLETPRQPATAMFDYLYATLPDNLAAQRAAAEQWDRDHE
ncbi:MAG: pyruvate dehydrogenase (acetyl-transferring) E1 component subunit alpha [Gammaproteobacteria bacterium]